MKGLIYTLLLLFMPLVASADNGLRCAKNVFSQPNVRFMHKIKSIHSDAVIGVKGLPSGLQWNARRNLVESKVKTPGIYTYSITSNIKGQVSEELIRLTVSDAERSEERHVGKECRSRWSPYH